MISVSDSTVHERSLICSISQIAKAVIGTARRSPIPRSTIVMNRRNTLVVSWMLSTCLTTRRQSGLSVRSKIVVKTSRMHRMKLYWTWQMGIDELNRQDEDSGPLSVSVELFMVQVQNGWVLDAVVLDHKVFPRCCGCIESLKNPLNSWFSSEWFSLCLV